VEKQDCSNLFLQTLFIVMSKGLSLAILVTLQILAAAEIDRIVSDYQWLDKDR